MRDGLRGGGLVEGRYLEELLRLLRKLAAKVLASEVQKFDDEREHG